MQSPVEQDTEAHKHVTSALNAHFDQALDGTPVELFHRTAATTPAYARFLAGHGIESSSIVTMQDLERVPPVSKENYISRHPLPDLCRNGSLHNTHMVAVSSGSTGSPAFWPRTTEDENAISWQFEQLFHDSFEAHRRPTLAIVCFALGTWVGGMYTASCCRNLAAKGYPVTVITPGNNREEIFRVVRELGQHYEQTVLLGYPPFLKDVIDTGLHRGIAWSNYNLRLVLAGEVFSEEWRSLVAERCGCKDIHNFASSLYGTADAGVLGCETPLSVTIRRWFASNPQAARELFGESRLPTLVQYDPCLRRFDMHEGRLLVTADSGIPLVRYNILDTGGVVTFTQMLAFLQERGFDAVLELGQQRDCPIRALPFVYVFGRSAFTVSFFGANIYPENITVGLEQPGIREWCTGKFVLQVVEDADKNRRLAVAVELAPGETGSHEREQAAAHSICDHLLRLNSEFGAYTPAEYRLPQVALLPTGDPEYFPVGVKHRYTRGT